MVDVLDSKSSVLWTCRFESDHRYQSLQWRTAKPWYYYAGALFISMLSTMKADSFLELKSG